MQSTLNQLSVLLGPLQSDLVLDDFLVSIQHEGYLFMVLMLLGNSIKTGNPRFLQARCQIRSKLLHITPFIIVIVAVLGAASRAEERAPSLD